MRNDTMRDIEEAIDLARAGDYEAAISIFEADRTCKYFPEAMAYYAYCVSELERNHKVAIDICMNALKFEKGLPSIHLNLGKILVNAGKRKSALKVLNRGLNLSGFNDTDIAVEINRLGIRRAPVLDFLPRGSGPNRLLGRLVDLLNSEIKFNSILRVGRG